MKQEHKEQAAALITTNNYLMHRVTPDKILDDNHVICIEDDEVVAFQSKILTWRTLIVTIIFLPMAIIVTVLMILLGMIVTGLEKLDTPVFKGRYED